MTSIAYILNTLPIRVIPTDAKDTCNSAHEAAVDIRCIKADMVGLLIHCRNANIMWNQELHRKFKRFCDNEDDRASYYATIPRVTCNTTFRHPAKIRFYMPPCLIRRHVQDAGKPIQPAIFPYMLNADSANFSPTFHVRTRFQLSPKE